MAAPRAVAPLLALTTVLAGCLATPATLDPQQAAGTVTGAVSSFTEVLCDPACNVRMGFDAGPANEVAIAMDPNNPARLLAGAKDYNDAYTDCVTISWYFSEDGGRTWEEGYFHPPRAVPLPHPGVGVPLPVPLPVAVPPKVEAQSCESDPVPVFDGAGNALMSTLSYGGNDPPAGLPTYRRAPGAAEWEVVAHAYEGTSDKQWADVDSATGEVYVVTRDLKEGAEHVEELVKTSDGGDTWEHLSYIDIMDFAQVAVRPGGHVYLAGLNFTDGAMRVLLLHSGDGGRTWYEPEVMGEVAMGFSNQGLNPASTKLYRTPPLPVIAASDRVPTVAVGWFDDVAGDMEVFLRVSKDGGRTWGEATSPSDAPAGSDQWTPAVAVSPAGDVHAMWFDARQDPTGEGRLVDVYYAHSTDGAAWDPNLRITEQSFLPYLGRHQAQPFFIGDYLGIQASDQEAVMIWPDTRTGTSEVFAGIVGGLPAE